MTSTGQIRIVGECAAISRALQVSMTFAPTPVPVLLVGATGTGKDMLARAIHDWSGRDGPIVDVNCGALPQELADGLLFGHRRGAFTGAVEAAAGLIEAARGGTLFLDELESLPLGGQVKLLRVLESGEVRRLGESEKRCVDFRVVAAVKDDLDERIAAGSMRLDLYQRVAGVVIQLPLLRDREGDIVLLARHFAAEHNRVLGQGSERILLSYAWPGNVRELQSAVERAVFLSNSPRLTSGALVEAIALGTPPVVRTQPAMEVMGEATAGDGGRRELVDVLNANGWHAERTAEALGIGRTTLFRRLRAQGISLRGKRQYQN
jgi:transcriptional regulator with PAS, ATPase and Fis domain